MTVFTKACHLFLSWARCIQSTYSHPISLRSVLMLSYHLLLGLSSGLFRSDFGTILHVISVPNFSSSSLPGIPWYWTFTRFFISWSSVTSYDGRAQTFVLIPVSVLQTQQFKGLLAEGGQRGGLTCVKIHSSHQLIHMIRLWNTESVNVLIH
jgi:hypothetical protein